MNPQDRPDGPLATGRTLYRYVVYWDGKEHYCDAATEAEACQRAAAAWASASGTWSAKELYYILLVDASVIRLRKVPKPMSSL